MRALTNVERVMLSLAQRGSVYVGVEAGVWSDAARRLVDAGLLEWSPRHVAALTDAGREALAVLEIAAVAS